MLIGASRNAPPVNVAGLNPEGDIPRDESVFDGAAKFVPDVFVPDGSIVTGDTSIDFNRDGRAEHVIVYEKKHSLDTPITAGYVVAGNIKDGWNILGASGKEVGSVTVGKFTATSGTPSVLIIETTGDTKEWHTMTWTAGALSTHSGAEARFGLLNSLGYFFNGRNDVLVSGNTIIENIPGYSMGTPLCCPDLPTLSISYTFTGNAISVKGFTKGSVAVFK